MKRSVQFGLIAISNICLLILLMTMFFFYKVMKKQNEELSQLSIIQQEKMINNAVEVKKERCTAIVHENSAWDELIDYINDPSDEDWVYDNIGMMSESYYAATIALFNLDSKVVYENPTEEYENIDFFGDVKVSQMFKTNKLHCFQYHDNRLFEYFGAYIVSSNDINTRQESPKGYLIFVREVNDNLFNEYIKQLGDIKVALATNIKELDEAKEKYSDMIFYSMTLNNHYGNPIAYMYFYTNNNTKEIFNNFMPILYILFVIVLVMFITILLYTRINIVRPLKVITESIAKEDIKVISTFANKKTEFGTLGKNIKDFLEHKNTLTNLNKELNERQQEMTQQNDLLAQQKLEIESQVENIKVLNLQIMERNKDTEKKNVQILVKNQLLEENAANIKRLQTLLDEQTYQMKFAQQGLAEANSSLDNIQNYARRLTSVVSVALTPTKHVFGDYFIYSKSKEQIGGDFCFAKKIDNWIIAGVGDCNMQGISGAVLSAIDLFLIQDILSLRKISELRSDLILNDLNDIIQNTMGEKYNTDIERDGLHISLFIYNTETLKGYFAAAKRTICITRRGEVTEYFGDTLSVGKIYDGKKFNCINIQLVPDDVVYMYSDGCTEIEGGPYMKKLLSVNFKKEIYKKQLLPLNEQKMQFKSFYENWIGDLKQTDDITLMAFKVN